VSKVATTNMLPRMQCTRPITLSCRGLLFLHYAPQSYIIMNVSMCQSRMYVLHYLTRVVYGAHILKK